MATKQKRRPAAKQPPALESLVNDAPRTFTDAEFPVGTVAHQGDVMFVRIARLPAGRPRKNRQLAEGTTQGSRHILKGGEVFDCDPREVARLIGQACAGIQVDVRYVGPVFRTREGQADVVHPEHGDHCYRGEDWVIATVFQRSLDAEEREQRVQD